MFACLPVVQAKVLIGGWAEGRSRCEVKLLGMVLGQFNVRWCDATVLYIALPHTGGVMVTRVYDGSGLIST